MKILPFRKNGKSLREVAAEQKNDNISYKTRKKEGPRPTSTRTTGPSTRTTGPSTSRPSVDCADCCTFGDDVWPLPHHCLVEEKDLPNEQTQQHAPHENSQRPASYSFEQKDKVSIEEDKLRHDREKDDSYIQHVEHSQVANSKNKTQELVLLQETFESTFTSLPSASTSSSSHLHHALHESAPSSSSSSSSAIAAKPIGTRNFSSKNQESLQADRRNSPNSVVFGQEQVASSSATSSSSATTREARTSNNNNYIKKEEERGGRAD
ncbi:unnamed protein product, partial [Amoebophrya sp. A25]|eukprot:GSA25T00023043001.1